MKKTSSKDTRPFHLSDRRFNQNTKIIEKHGGVAVSVQTFRVSTIPNQGPRGKYPSKK